MKAKFINESPNFSFSFDEMYPLEWGSGRPFGYIDGEIIIGDDMTTHEQMDDDFRGNSTSQGRIFDYDHIIAFWDDTSKNELDQILFDISQHTDYSVDDLKTKFRFDLNQFEYDESDFEDDEEKMIEYAEKHIVRYDDFPTTGIFPEKPKDWVKPSHNYTPNEKEKLRKQEVIKRKEAGKNLMSKPKIGSNHLNRKPLSWKQAMYSESCHSNFNKNNSRNMRAKLVNE